MADYIDRQTALEALSGQIKINRRLGAKREQAVLDGVTEYINGATDRIKAIPSADVVPERHGRWEVYVISMLDGEDIRCSECGKGFCEPSWAFCPHCGAIMDGE